MVDLSKAGILAQTIVVTTEGANGIYYFSRVPINEVWLIESWVVREPFTSVLRYFIAGVSIDNTFKASVYLLVPNDTTPISRFLPIYALPETRVTFNELAGVANIIFEFSIYGKIYYIEK